MLAVLLELSVAVTVMTFDPDASETADALHDVVPDAVPLEAELLEVANHVTVVTPQLSLAAPDMVIVLDVVEYVLLLVGDVIVTAGVVIS